MKISIRSIIITFAVVIFLTTLLSCFFPASSPFIPVGSSIVVGIIVFSAYFGLCPVNRDGFAALAVFWAILSAGVVINSYYFTTFSGGTPLAPVLHNDDAHVAWEEMYASIAGSESDISVFRRGYGDFLAFISLGHVLPIEILLYVNSLFILLSIVLTGATAAALRTDSSTDSSCLATAAMLVTGGVAYYLCAGTILIKDALCCLLMSMVLFATIGNCRAGAAFAMLIVAVAVGALVRRWFPAVMAVALVMGMVLAPRRKAIFIGSFALVAILLFFILHDNGLAAPIIDSDGTSSFYLGDRIASTRLRAYEAVAGPYESLSVFQRLIRLPFSLAVQALIPLPWAFTRDIVFGPMQAYAHCSFAWYAVLGLMIYYLIFCFRRSPLSARVSACFAIVAWCGTAFVTGGTVSRYCLPWLPFIAVPVAWLLCSDRVRVRSFMYWAVSWCLTMIVSLTVVFAVLNHYSPTGWTAQ